MAEYNIYTDNSTHVPNAVIDKVVRKLHPYATVCYLIILRQTKGWHKKSDWISKDQFTEKTGMTWNTIKKYCEQLEKAGLITRTEIVKRGSKTYEYSLVNSPVILYHDMTVSQYDSVKASSSQCQSKEMTVSQCDTTKETITKETITKESSNKSDLNLLAEFNITGDLAKDFIKVRKSHKAPITKTALNGFVRESRKANISLEEAIRFTTEKCWRGFNAEWFKNQKPNYNNNGYQNNAETYNPFVGSIEEIVLGEDCIL